MSPKITCPQDDNFHPISVLTRKFLFAALGYLGNQQGGRCTPWDEAGSTPGVIECVGLRGRGPGPQCPHW